LARARELRAHDRGAASLPLEVREGADELAHERARLRDGRVALAGLVARAVRREVGHARSIGELLEVGLRAADGVGVLSGDLGGEPGELLVERVRLEAIRALEVRARLGGLLGAQE